MAIVGHCNPEVVAAVKSQAERLITCHSSLYNDAPRDLPREAHLVHAEGARRRVPLEQRGGGQRGRDKARQEVHGEEGADSDEGRVPREDRRRALRHVEQEVQGSLRASPPVLQARRVREPRRARGGDRRGHCGGHARADSGRRRDHTPSSRLPEGRPGAVRQTGNPHDRRRGPDRARPHREALGRRELGGRARRPGLREGPRRRRSHRGDHSQAGGAPLAQEGRADEHVRGEPARRAQRAPPLSTTSSRTTCPARRSPRGPSSSTCSRTSWAGTRRPGRRGASA